MLSYYNSVFFNAWWPNPTDFTFTCITALVHMIVRWQWFPRQSDPFSRRVSLTWFHPRVTSMGLNLEQLKSLVKSDNTVTFVHSARPCIRANCSPDVNIHSHLITLHSDVCVGVQVNLNWAWISRKIKNILIGWQSWLAVWFQSDYAISNGPGPPTDECSMEICLKDTPWRS